MLVCVQTKPLNMEKTLEENNIPDESEEFAKLMIPEDEYVPTLHVYFNDDLTIGWIDLEAYVEF